MNPVPASAPPASSRRVPWPMLAIVLLALALRLPAMRESVWIGELSGSELFCGDLASLLETACGYEHPPGYLLAMYLWNHVSGAGVVWLRLPVLLCGLASVVVVGRLGEACAGRAAGLAAALLLATAPVHVWYSAEAQAAAVSTLLVLVATDAYLRLAGGAGGRWPVLVVLGALAGAASMHFHAVVFAALFLVVALVRRPPRWRWVAIGCGAIVALLAGFMILRDALVGQPAATELRTFDLSAGRDLLFRWGLTGDVLTPRGAAAGAGAWQLLLCQVLAVLACVRGAWRLLTNAPSGGLVLGLLAVLPVSLWIWSGLGLPAIYVERDALPVLPFFFLVLAAGVTGWRRKLFDRVALGGILVFGGLLSLAAHVHGNRWTVEQASPDWRVAARALGGGIGSSAAPILVFVHGASAAPLTFYDGRIREVERPARAGSPLAALGFDADLTRLEEEARAAAAEARVRVLHLARFDPMAVEPNDAGFWLLVHGEPDDAVRSVLEHPRLRVAAQRPLRGLALYHMMLRDE